MVVPALVNCRREHVRERPRCWSHSRQLETTLDRVFCSAPPQNSVRSSQVKAHSISFPSAVRDQISSLGLPKRSSSWQVPHDCGHNDNIDAGFFSHSPLAAQSGQAVSLSAHTVVHTPHVFGQSRMTAPGLFAHSVSPQIAHCVEFLSSHVVAWQTWHEPGQVFSVKPGFSWHCPAVAQPGQSLCVTLHSSRQTPQETGQCLSMKSGFSAHAPDEVQPAQSSCTSLHVGEHKPHDVGHAFSMKPAFLVQSPFLAHAGQDTSVSSHVRVQVPQECGQSSAKYSLFAPLHSPSFAQPAQEFDLSLQKPAAETTATDAARSKSILADVLSRVIGWLVCTRQTCFFVRWHTMSEAAGTHEQCGTVGLGILHE